MSSFPPRDPLTEMVIGLAIEVHRTLGPGLLESVYESCLALELERARLGFRRQVPCGLTYKGLRLECAFRMDIVIEEKVVVELKTVDQILPVHQAQILTYLRLSGLQTGILLNFNTPVLKDGVRRFSL